MGASAVSKGALGAIGAVIGVRLGLGCYLLFKAACGGGFPPPLAIALVAIAAVAIAAPAVLPQRVPASVALATE